MILTHTHTHMYIYIYIDLYTNLLTVEHRVSPVAACQQLEISLWLCSAVVLLSDVEALNGRGCEVLS